VGETPIIFADRRAGTSKVNLREMTRSLSVLVWLGLHAFLGVREKPRNTRNTRKEDRKPGPRLAA
jgi:hypothetical protein